MKAIRIVGAAVCLNLALSLGGSASVVSQYLFGADGNDPYSDSVGTNDLRDAGSTGGAVTFAEDGYVHFEGVDGDLGSTRHLESDAFVDLDNPSVLKLWFRTSNTMNQSNYSSIFSSNDDSDGGFQIDFFGSVFRINIKSSQNNYVVLSEQSDLSSNEWHLVTVFRDTVAGTGTAWLDTSTNVTIDTANLELNTFRLGVNRNGKRQFEGDIADVSALTGNGTSWSDADQAAAFEAGPAIPEPAAVSLIGLMGTILLVAGRRLRDTGQPSEAARGKHLPLAPPTE